MKGLGRDVGPAVSWSQGRCLQWQERVLGWEGRPQGYQGNSGPWAPQGTLNYGHFPSWCCPML